MDRNYNIMELTEKEFCKAYTDFYGEEITSIAQIQLNRSTGQEMFEFVEGLVKNLTIPVVVKQRELVYCTCSKAKGTDFDDELNEYCIDCQKPIQ